MIAHRPILHKLYTQRDLAPRSLHVRYSLECLNSLQIITIDTNGAPIDRKALK